MKKKYSIDLNDYVHVDSSAAWKKVDRMTTSSKNYRLRRRSISYAAAILLFFIGISSYFLIFEQERLSPRESIISAQMPIIEKCNDKEIILISNGKSHTITESLTLAKSIETLKIEKSKSSSESSEIYINELIVPHGKIHKVILSDGTEVTLNANSRLIFPSKFDSKSRLVEIEGEGYFKVKKSNIPFIVDYNGGKIKVLGTTFNVCTYAEENVTSTTLLSGSVQVLSFIKNGTTEHILKPMEQYNFNKKTGKEEVIEVDTEYITSWMTNEFQFQNMRLEDIIAQLKRWYQIDIIYTEEQLKDLKFTGVAYKENPVNELFRIIEQTTNVKFGYTKENKIIVTNAHQ